MKRQGTQTKLTRPTLSPEDFARLTIASSLPPPDDPPLDVGDKCRLYKGGPEMIVIAANNLAVRCKHEKNKKISVYQRAVVRRV